MSNQEVIKRQVVVVGAGPIGLTAALALRHLGLPAAVIEAEPEDRLRPGSRAIFFHNATLKHLEEISPGAGFAFARGGIVWPVKRTLWRGKQVYFKKYGTPKPDVLPPFTSLPQVEAERILLQACVDAGVEFTWNTPIASVESDDSGVTLHAENGSVWRADYVVGADGARSSVRRAAGITMEGPRIQDTFVVVDVKEDPQHPLPLERVFHYQHPAMGGRNVLFVPFAGGWRVDLQLFEGDDVEEYGSEDGVRKWIPKVMDAKYADRISWVSTYQFLQVVARSFTDENRRIVLAGEAAHLFAPFGARGMNSGVPDAIMAAKGICAAIQAENAEQARKAIDEVAEERRAAACYNRDCAGIALHHIQGNKPGINLKRRMAAILAPHFTRFGRWLDEGPYGPRTGPSLKTKY